MQFTHLLFLFLLNGKLGCVLNKQRFLSFIAGTPLIPKPIIVKGINLKCLSKKTGSFGCQQNGNVGRGPVLDFKKSFRA